MGYLGEYWTALHHIIADNKSSKRDMLSESTDLLVMAAHQLPDPDKNEPGLPGTYSIYAASKDMGIAHITHMFVRLVGPDKKVLCDIHGIRHPVDGTGYLQAIIEPTDLEYFGSLKGGRDILLWEGSAVEAAEKMRSTIELVGEINAAKKPYEITDQNCNTLFHSLLDVMELKVPANLPGWVLGIGHELRDEICYAQQNMGTARTGSRWMNAFAEALRIERSDIAAGFAELNKSRTMAGAALIHA